MEDDRFFQKFGCGLERQKTPPSGVELICKQWQAMAYSKTGIIYEKPGRCSEEKPGILTSIWGDGCMTITNCTRL